MKTFYKSNRWKKKRKVILKRDDYKCQECKRYGKNTPATTVHHIIPLEQMPVLKLNNLNLISLCQECHNKMHDRITDELTELGRKWVERVSPHLLNREKESLQTGRGNFFQ